MLSLLVERDEIAEAQETLQNVMRVQFPKHERRNISFRPRVLSDQEVWTRANYWYRPAVHEGRNGTTPRFLNWFGVLAQGTLNITVEVNIAFEWRNGRAEGFFARDDSTGALYLMHSGNVGGGRPGIGGRAFRAWYGKRCVPVFVGDKCERFGFVVIPIRAADPTRSARRYIDSIEEFKNAVSDGEVDPEDPDFQRTMQEFDDFYKEPRGRRRGYRPGGIDYLSRHGEVVDALHAWREAQPLTRGHRFVKNVFIDMGVADRRNNLVELYEVKTSSERSDVYTAIGQLLVHGTADCENFLVLPRGRQLPNDLADALERNQIEMLRFRLNNRGARIL